MRRHVERETRLDHEYTALNRVLERLEARERRQQHLALVWVLREPRQIGAAVDHAHLHLEDCTGIALLTVAACRVLERLRLVGGRR